MWLQIKYLLNTYNWDSKALGDRKGVPPELTLFLLLGRVCIWILMPFYWLSKIATKTTKGKTESKHVLKWVSETAG